MKFNFLIKRTNGQTTNFENAPAYIMSPEQELYAAVVTAGLNDTFYENADHRLERIISLMQKCSAEFVAKLAIYTRREMYLRSVPLVLVTELAKMNNGNDLVRKAVNGVVQRADEITELLAYYQIANKRSGTKKLNRISKQVQKGLVLAFNKFDEYQFAKYNRAAEIKLKDALFLVHPKPKDAGQQVIFDKIAGDNLETPYTWEVALSTTGQQAYRNEAERKQAFKARWEELIDSGKVGYMALMRNLRNILEAEVSALHIEKVCARLADANEVARSKQLPFRFLAAYRELKMVKSTNTTALMDALEDAVLESAANIRGFDWDTQVVIACDVSGSMQKPVSPKSKVLLYDIGLMLGMLLQSRCKHAVSGMFGDRWKIINLSRKSVLSNVEAFYRREGEVGYATNGYLVLEDLISRKAIVDKVMLFTDTQMWNNNTGNKPFADYWRRYKLLAPDAKLYLFDLAGYGRQPVDLVGNDAYLIAGWSDKVFEVLQSLEQGSAAVEMINAVAL
ncbi:TROVE domain-containing protein [Taibaiella sp. KBW10]|uniref:TROVE domain-containing protein n=1 Tax=Taibaiella sp. KBW10 TaxID=2153357 RepID=UPI000F5B63F9|nr:TROVE domain-containing protein [Taibaiella sp. KBW10]RQO30273.1 TROVE domain-containing protein [Taibaiella sp. KBW10]